MREIGMGERMTDAISNLLKSQADKATCTQIANLAASDAAHATSTPTPLAFPARTKAERDPRGAIAPQFSRPLPVRPYLILKAKAVRA